jgi:hypothetical protein
MEPRLDHLQPGQPRVTPNLRTAGATLIDTSRSRKSTRSARAARARSAGI